jgi:hypothetical protein
MLFSTSSSVEQSWPLTLLQFLLQQPVRASSHATAGAGSLPRTPSAFKTALIGDWVDMDVVLTKEKSWSPRSGAQSGYYADERGEFRPRVARPWETPAGQRLEYDRNTPSGA